MNKKVLIIAYYWPPSGGSGVQRWLKFVKYLPQFGWEPYVFTPENPSFTIRDESLLKDVPVEAEVIRFPIWEPYEHFSKLSGAMGQRKSASPTDFVSTKNHSLFQRISTFIRANFFIPDPRVFWVRPSVKFLNDFLKEKEFYFRILKINSQEIPAEKSAAYLNGIKELRWSHLIEWARYQ